MPITIAAFTMNEYDEAYALWQRIDEMAGSPGDEPGKIERYLARNPGISSVALDDGRVVGVLLAGHDGRRGSMWRLAVDSECRRQGIARRLVERSLEQLRAEGIDRCFLFVLHHNEAGRAFWASMGWKVAERANSMWRETACPVSRDGC